KIFMRTALMAFIAIIFIWILYSFILYGKFSIWIVSFFENAFRHRKRIQQGRKKFNYIIKATSF
ncbi:hypothetical protein ACTPD5_21690, partial [Clostridioides difficile]